MTWSDWPSVCGPFCASPKKSAKASLARRVRRWSMPANATIPFRALPPQPPAAAPAPAPLLVDVPEAARLLGVSARTLWQLTKDGKVSCQKSGRRTLYSRAALEDFATESDRQRFKDIGLVSPASKWRAGLLCR